MLSVSSKSGVGFVEDGDKPLGGSFNKSTDDSFERDERLDYNTHVTTIIIVSPSSSIQPLSNSNIIARDERPLLREIF